MEQRGLCLHVAGSTQLGVCERMKLYHQKGIWQQGRVAPGSDWREGAGSHMPSVTAGAAVGGSRRALAGGEADRTAMFRKPAALSPSRSDHQWHDFNGDN
eukprot:759510-Hanusia_phi.AAC.1